MQEQVLPPKLEEVPQVTAALTAADPNHWNIVNDPIYPSCLKSLRQGMRPLWPQRRQHQLVEPVAKERVLLLPRNFPLRLGCYILPCHL